MKFTRRELAAVAAVGAGSVPALLESGQSEPHSAPDDLQVARDRLKANSQALARVPLPMSTEPAFQFKA
jgi:hypothetical protein